MLRLAGVPYFTLVGFLGCWVVVSRRKEVTAGRRVRKEVSGPSDGGRGTQLRSTSSARGSRPGPASGVATEPSPTQTRSRAKTYQMIGQTLHRRKFANIMTGFVLSRAVCLSELPSDCCPLLPGVMPVPGLVPVVPSLP